MGRLIQGYWPEIATIVILVASATTPSLRRTWRRFASWLTTSTPIWAGTVASSIALVVAVVIPFAFDAVEYPARAHYVLLLIIAQACGIALPLLHQEELRKLLTAGADTISRNVARSLVPLTGLVKQITEHRHNAASKRTLQGRADQVALSAAALLLGQSTNTRASWFVVTGSKPNRQLTPPIAAGSVGRMDVASTAFHEGTILGDGIFSALDADQYMRCGDIETSAPAGWTPHLTVWKSFLSVPVTFDGQLVGMLTVDSPDKDDFNSPSDPGTAVAIPHLLATALRA